MPETSFVGKYRIDLPETTSTNNYAAELLIQNPPEGTLIQTFNQIQGRGQQGNSWEAAPGQNLTFSLIFYPSFLELNAVFSLSKAISIALCETVAEFLPDQDIEIKWPNDLLINRKKSAGILIENQLEGSQIKSTIVGIGLNVNQDVFSPEIAFKATSMQKVVRKSFLLEDVLKALLFKIENRYLMLKNSQNSVLDRLYYQYLYGYQEDIWVEIDGKQQIVSIIGVEKSGKLALKVNGGLRYFDFKELTFIL